MLPEYFVANLSKWDHKLVERAVAAWQKQLSNEFAEACGVSAVLHFKGPHQLEPAEPGLTIDDGTSAEYLGEHHLEGVPRGIVLLGACLAAGDSPEETGSHELQELTLDPDAADAVELPDGTFEAKEACDAVQGTSYFIDGVEVANFVHPFAYFNERGTRYDHRGVLSKPHTLTPGGYRLLKRQGEGWTQELGHRALAAARMPSAWSRRGRRIVRGLGQVAR